MTKPATPRADQLREMREAQWHRDQAALRAAAGKAPKVTKPRPAKKRAKRK
jgi:hypothetical protein